MARKGRSKSSEKNRQILNAAIELFVEGGYHSTSMDMIAANAGVSKQTVYSHFSSKQDLFRSAVKSKRSDYLTHSLLLDPAAPLHDSLMEFALALLGLLLSEDVVRTRRVCEAEAESHPEVAAAYFAEGPEHVTGLLSDYLAHQHKTGKLHIGTPRYAAIQLLHMVTGEAQLKALLNQPGWNKREIKTYVNSCIEMFLRAYGPDQR